MAVTFQRGGGTANESLDSWWRAASRRPKVADAVSQVIDRGYSVVEVAERLGVSSNSLELADRASRRLLPLLSLDISFVFQPVGIVTDGGGSFAQLDTVWAGFDAGRNARASLGSRIPIMSLEIGISEPLSFGREYSGLDISCGDSGIVAQDDYSVSRSRQTAVLR